VSRRPVCYLQPKKGTVDSQTKRYLVLTSALTAPVAQVLRYAIKWGSFLYSIWPTTLGRYEQVSVGTLPADYAERRGKNKCHSRWFITSHTTGGGTTRAGFCSTQKRGQGLKRNCQNHRSLSYQRQGGRELAPQLYCREAITPAANMCWRETNSVNHCPNPVNYVKQVRPAPARLFLRGPVGLAVSITGSDRSGYTKNGNLVYLTSIKGPGRERARADRAQIGIAFLNLPEKKQQSRLSLTKRARSQVPRMGGSGGLLNKKLGRNMK